MPGKKKIIGIIGTIGSGKDTVAEYISIKLKIPSFQISQPLRDIAKDNNIEPTRENLINIGSALIKENGPNFFAELVLDKIDSNIGIITGIRVLGVIDYLRENSNFVLLALQSDPQIRFERSIIRSKLGEAKTLEEFINNEKAENSVPNVQRLFECIDIADYTIENNSDLESLHKKVDQFLSDNKFI